MTPTTRSELTLALSVVCNELELDAIEALLIQAERLLKGQKKYGPLNVRNDPRNWTKERQEEFRDALNYFAFEDLITRRRTQPEPSQPTLPMVSTRIPRTDCVHKWRTEGVCDRCGHDEKPRNRKHQR